MELVIGKGVGEITFGLSPKDVETLWGKPTKIKHAEMQNGVYYEYAPHKTTLFFDRDEKERLYSIETKDNSVRLYGKVIIRKSANEIIPFIKQYSPLTDESDYGYWKDFEFEDIGLSASVRYDKVKAIRLEVLWENDKISWP